jgi:hypothetical protein
MRCLFALALAGCMKIYPSSELPDLDVEWYAEDCESETSEIAIGLVNLHDGSTSETLHTCADSRATIEDVDRVRYRVDGTLLASDGSVIVTASEEADLRNGIDTEVYLYFPRDVYLRVLWVFEAGSSCESLDVDTIELDFLDPQYGMFTETTSCASGVYAGYPFGTDLTVMLRAVSAGETVAVSERSEPIVVMPPERVDIGPLTLVPCGTSCPD